MPDVSPILSLPFLQPSQAQKHVTHNESLQLLDVLVQLVVQDRGLFSPPAIAVEGACYIVNSGSSGAWAGHDNEIAVSIDNIWKFIAPKIGWMARVPSENLNIQFDGADWISVSDVAQTVPEIGVNTSSDITNRLAVSAAATLLTHEGNGHQLKINKAAISDTASLLFQTGFSGRAEMGLAGDDDFSIKVSADGSTFTSALTIDASTGQAEIPQGINVGTAITGLAVQQSPSDITAGRVMRADYGYGPGNVVGPVSQSVGVPTGAILERGSNANGQYTKFADGTVIFSNTLNLPYFAANVLRAPWTFPVAVIADTARVTVSRNSNTANDVNVPVTSVSVFAAQTNSSTQSLIAAYRSSGAPIFAANSLLTAVSVFGMARWF